MSCHKYFKSKYLELECSDPQRFTRSQWCHIGKVSFWYLLYRWSLVVLFLSAITGHIISVHGHWKWIIFMTDQGITILAINYVIEAILVTVRFVREKKEDLSISMELEPSNLPLSYKVSWALQNMSFTIALWITIVYWSLLHPHVVELHILDTPAAVGFNFFLHAINTISCIVDMFLTDRPWKIGLMYIPFGFGLWYLFFSVVYWAAGGTGLCTTDCYNPHLDPDICPVHCNPYIYPILDYENHPGKAVALVLGGCLVIPLLHSGYYLLYMLRLKIFQILYPPTPPQRVELSSFIQAH